MESPLNILSYFYLCVCGVYACMYACMCVQFHCISVHACVYMCLHMCSDILQEYSCMCVCALTYVFRYTAWVCMRAETGGWCWLSSSVSPPYIVKQGLSLKPRTCWFCWSRKPSCSESQSLPPEMRDCHTCLAHQEFMWIFRNWTLLFWLMWHSFIQWSSFPCPCLRLYSTDGLEE